MGTNIELYEALRGHVGDEGARLIAEVVPATDDLATRDDLQIGLDGLRQEMDGLRQDMRLGFAEFRAEMADFKAEIRGWLLKFFVPLWIGVYATLGAMIVSIVVRSG